MHKHKDIHAYTPLHTHSYIPLQKQPFVNDNALHVFYSYLFVYLVVHFDTAQHLSTAHDQYYNEAVPSDTEVHSFCNSFLFHSIQ